MFVGKGSFVVMKRSRVIVLGIAFLSAAGAAFLAKSMVGGKKTERVVQERLIDTSQILVAAQPIKIGSQVEVRHLKWQPWPNTAMNPSYVSRRHHKTAIEDFQKSIARTSFQTGEPINIHKLIKRNQGSVMAAILTPGMRAISTKIKEATSAGGFILPNDRVDVILSRKIRESRETRHVSSTILTNVRVLAIGQNIEQPKGQHATVGKTATLELSPAQSETLTLAESLGEISLALRSMAESLPGSKGEQVDNLQEDNSGVVRVMKFGRRVQGIGVN